MQSRIFAGTVAAQAITLARAAKFDITGPQDAFEQKNGFFALLNGGQSAPSCADSLGQRWRLETPGLLFKTSPVCSAAHAVIELTAQLLQGSGKTSEDIFSAAAEVPELVAASLVYHYPENVQQAQFSLPYCFACAAEHGQVRLDDLKSEELESDKKWVSDEEYQYEHCPRFVSIAHERKISRKHEAFNYFPRRTNRNGILRRSFWYAQSSAGR